MNIKKNVGNLDQTIRIILGIIFLVIAYFLPTGIWQIFIYILVAILALSSFLNFCPVYKLLKINTNKKETKTPHA